MFWRGGEKENKEHNSGPPFGQGDLLKVKVNKLACVKTQLPYFYYSLPYCKPDKIVNMILDNLPLVEPYKRGDMD